MVKHPYKFEPFDTLVDVYVDGLKVREKHNGNLGQVYLFTESENVEVKPHDPRIPIQAECTPKGMVKVEVDFIEVPPAKATKS